MANVHSANLKRNGDREFLISSNAQKLTRNGSPGIGAGARFENERTLNEENE